MIEAIAEVMRFISLTTVLFTIPICISDIFDRDRKRKRISRYRERERRQELVQRENEYQRKMACEIWRLEKAKANQQITIKGCFATPEAAEMLRR